MLRIRLRMPLPLDFSFQFRWRWTSPILGTAGTMTGSIWGRVSETLPDVGQIQTTGGLS